jgi:hypothetical protein
VVEVAQRREAEADEVVAAATVHVGHEPDTAGVVLEPGVVEALGGGRVLRRHASSCVDRGRSVGTTSRDDIGPSGVSSL